MATKEKVKQKPVFTILAIIIMVIFIIKNIISPSNIDLEEFEAYLEGGKISEVTISDKTTGFIYEGKKMKTQPITDDKLMEEIMDREIDLKIVKEKPSPPVFLLIIIFGLVFLAFTALRRLSSLRVYRNFKYLKDDIPLSLKSESKNDNIITGSLKTLSKLNKLIHNEDLNKSRIPNKILLDSETSGDKSQDLANILDLPCYSESMIGVYNMFRMLGAYRIDNLFEVAHDNKPCIVYFNANLPGNYKEIIKEKRLHVNSRDEAEYHNTEQRLVLIQIMEELNEIDKDIIFILEVKKNNPVLKDILDEDRFDMKIRI